MPCVSWTNKVCVFITALTLGVTGLNAASLVEKNRAELEKLFANPPAETKILKIIHNWPDEAERQDAVRKQLLKQQGFGGIVSNVSFDQYMESDTHWEQFVRAITEAKKDGANLWLYDEKGYPSGNAGGLVLKKNPEWEAIGLLTISHFYDQEQTVELTIPPGKVISAQAIPLKDGSPDLEHAISLSDFIQDGHLKTDIPAGYYLTLITQDKLYEGTHADGNLFSRIPYINLLSKEATREFARLTYENYAAHLGNNLGKWFESTFTDEPSLMSVFLKTMPYGCLPWEQSFAKTFQERCGYDLTPLIPLLAIDSPAKNVARVKYDFWKTVGDLVAENYFGQLQEYCAKYNIPSGGHLISEESMATHIPFYGSYFACERRLDAPSIDCLTSLPGDVPWHIALQASSIAQLNNDRLVMSETSDHSQVWRPAGDTRPKTIVSVDEMRGTFGRQIVGGINRFTSYYSWIEKTDEQIRELNNWTGRSILMTEGGDQVADIAVLYPVESCWIRYNPSRCWANDAPEVLNISECYQTVSDSLWHNAREFTYIDSQAISESVVGNFGLEHPCGLNWHVIVLPMTDTLPLPVWEQLEQFVQRGGILIAAGALPQNSATEFPCDTVQEISSRLFGDKPEPFRAELNNAGGAAIYLPYGMVSRVASVIDSLFDRDFTSTSKNSVLRVTHRSFPDHETYFVFNDSGKPCEESVRFAATGTPQCWNPNDGSVTTLPESAEYKITLAPWNAIVFTFDRQVQRKTKVTFSELPQYTETTLPLDKPIIAKGEFVRSELIIEEKDPAHKEWKSLSAITKSDVDCYMFLSFEKEMNFSGMEMLALDVKFPTNQRIPTQLLVIIRDGDDAEYLASTGFILNGKSGIGFQRIYVPKTNFHLAGWSKDSNGELNWDKIKFIRIGWGGYLGKEGETVDFTIKNVTLLK